jgi:6-pyruvoyltetrahydropterin/6-carboxytetrahydropterin synthase
VYTVSKEIEFDAGHRVPNHKSKCRNPHGHRYRVQAVVEGPLGDEPGVSSEGMVVDFSDLKALLTDLHDRYDHGFIIYDEDNELWKRLNGAGWKLIGVPFVPTAENLARDAYDYINDHMNWPDCRLVRVNVWETPTSIASYESDPGVVLTWGY